MSNDSIERSGPFCDEGRNCYENCSGWSCKCGCHCSTESPAMMPVAEHQRIVKELEGQIWKVVFNVVSTHPDHATRFLIRQLEAAREAAGCGLPPSLSDAIKEVERLYDEWWDVDRRRWLNVVLERLKSLGTQRED